MAVDLCEARWMRVVDERGVGGPMTSMTPEPPSRLLLAFDGSDLSHRAIEHAAALKPGAHALVLCVSEPLPVVLPTPVGAAAVANAAEPLQDPDGITTTATERARDIARQGAALAEGVGLRASWDTTIARGTSGIADAIVEKAQSAGASMIVLGSHGRSALGAALLGSVSTAVLHRACMPVLVVPAACDG
jgi:nucleotide-binding universal stress UspA family protein